MLFNSLQYAVFLPLVALGYYLLPHRVRWAWLLTASCLFYAAWIPAYLLVLFLVIGIDFVAGLMIEDAPVGRRRAFLGLSLAANLGVLGFFKYYEFINQNLKIAASLVGLPYVYAPLGFLLPIGLSFHTFQAMSYTIEVYRGQQRAERHLGIYALYVMFFPQLVAGPIERPAHMLGQFRTHHRFSYDDAWRGLALIMWGLFKKVVIADRLALYVAPVYANPQAHAGVTLVIATVFFAFQIYADFSGYSDIAIGSAQLLGFELSVNFRRPYFSGSVSEFWRRWHISLSSWFRDYVYIPLGGGRVGRRTGRLCSGEALTVHTSYFPTLRVRCANVSLLSPFVARRPDLSRSYASG